MNLITSNIDSAKTMTLKEITDLIGVRHDKALLKVATMTEDPEFGTVSIMDIVYNDKGQTIKTCLLNQRQSIAVASRLNVALLMRVIDRWQELENQLVKPQLPDFTNPIEAARAWADEAEAKQIAQALVEKQSAYIERQGKFIDVLEKQHAKGFTPPMFAREMNGVNCQQVQNYLADKKNWMRKTKDGWVATSYARDKYLSVTFKTGTDGIDRPLCELTKEGAAAMYRIYCKGELPMKKSWNGDFTPSKYLPILSDEVTA